MNPETQKTAAAIETCFNCGATIGRFEQAHIWRGEVICEACHRKLAASSAAPEAVPAGDVEPGGGDAPAAGPRLPMRPELLDEILWSGRPSRWQFFSLYLFSAICLIIGMMWIFSTLGRLSTEFDAQMRALDAAPGADGKGLDAVDDISLPPVSDGASEITGGTLVILLGLVVFLVATIRRAFRHYQITTRMITFRWGILSHHTREIPLHGVRELVVRQGMFDRIFKIGDVGIATAATSGVEVWLRGVPGPQNVRNIIYRRTRQA